MPEYTNSPWNGLATLDIRGPNGSTLYSLSIVDSNLASFGNQAIFQGAPGSSFTLRLEWIHTRQGAPLPSLVVVELREPGVEGQGGGQVGVIDWSPTITSNSAFATRTVHFDTEPLNQTAGVSRSGPMELYLYIENDPEWAASSRGFVGGTKPLPFNYARGLLDTVSPPTLDVQDFSDTEGSGTGVKNFNVPVTLSSPAATNVRFAYYTGDLDGENGTALVGTDFVSKTSFRTLIAGASSVTIRMEVNQDASTEDDETFFAKIKDAFVDDGGTTPHPEVVIGRNKATVTIINDDAIPPPPPDPETEGFMAGFLWSAMSINPSNVDAYLGKDIPVTRIFDPNWRITIPTAVSTAVTQGRLVLYSVKPPNNSSGVQKWTEITNGANNSGIDTLGINLKNLGVEIVFILHHEPHDDTSDLASGDTGTSTQYRAAVRYIHDRWKNKGILAKEITTGGVWMGYCAGDGGSKGSHNPITGGTDPMYAGGDVIDVLAHDSYNWRFNNCKTDPWETVETTWLPYVKVAHVQRKKLISGETGSYKSEGSNSRNAWFRDSATWIKTGTIPANQGFPAEPVSKWFKGFCYFNRLHQDTCSSEWRFVNQESSGTVVDINDGRVGWQDAYRNDSFFKGNPFTLRDSTAPATCSENYTRNSAVDGAFEGAGEISGACASKKFPDVIWGVRDSGHPAEIYRCKKTTEGAYNLRAIAVTGASNSDWEDCIYADEGNSNNYIYVMDTGANPKKLIKVNEPSNPDTATAATVVATYFWRFPSNSESVCGPSDNCEAVFFWPQPNGSATGVVYAVLKRSGASWVYRLGTPSQLSTSSGSPTVGTFVGAINHGCISAFAINTSGDRALSIVSGGSGDGNCKIWKGDGLSVEGLLQGQALQIASFSLPATVTSAGNFEAATVFPWGSCDVQCTAESRLGYLIKNV